MLFPTAFFILQSLNVVKAQVDPIEEALSALDGEKNGGVFEYYFENGAFHTSFMKSSSRRANLPDNFDIRDAFKECTTLNETLDTGNCTAPLGKIFLSTVNDRSCTRSKDRPIVDFSLSDLLSCCPTCQTNKTMCKNTKNIFEAVKYWLSEGIVSGGPHNSNIGCKPFPDDMYTFEKVGKCETRCTNINYRKTYEEDKSKGEKLNVIIRGSLHDIKKELMNGPIIAYWPLTEDFFYHKTGIYKYEVGALLGVVPVKIIGWGTNNNNTFWWIFFPKVSNRHNKTGYFQIQRDGRLERLIFIPQVYKSPVDTTTKKARDPALSISLSTILWISTIVVVLMEPLRFYQFL